MMKDKLVSLEEAAVAVKNGDLLGLRSSSVDNAPMAFLRELVRRRVKGLRVVTLTDSGLGIDLLIGAGAITQYETSSCSLGEYGPAPNFQRELLKGSFKQIDNT